MVALVSLLSHLVSLCFEFDGHFSSQVVVNVGRALPQMERLHLRAPLDMNALQRAGPPLFPALHDLRVGAVMIFADEVFRCVSEAYFPKMHATPRPFCAISPRAISHFQQMLSVC
jgi:hypothetical protein